MAPSSAGESSDAASAHTPDPASMDRAIARTQSVNSDENRRDPSAVPDRGSLGHDTAPANALTATARRFLARGARWHAILLVLATVPLLVVNEPRFVVSLALGALIMFANLTMATRTLLRAFLQTTDVPQSRASALAWASRWPLLALALLGILWYMPARPEGLALGIGLSLLSSVIAALRLSETDPHHG